MLPLKEMLLLQRLEMDGVGHFPPLRFSGALRVPMMNLFLLLFVVPVLQGHRPPGTWRCRSLYKHQNEGSISPMPLAPINGKSFSKVENSVYRDDVSAEEKRS